MVSSSEFTKARSELALLHRNEPHNAEAIAQKRRDLRAARLADVVRETVAQLPPLTPEQRDRIAILLRGGAA